MFIRCHSEEAGGGLHFSMNDQSISNIFIGNLSFLLCCSKSGSGIQISKNLAEIIISNCKFERNKSSWHGGSCLFENTKKTSIKNCLFDGNIANKKYSSSSLYLLSEKAEGRGGAIFISSSSDAEETSETKFLIEECTFKNNQGYDGNSIYIEGYGYGNEFVIHQNNFTNNFRAEKENNDPYFIYGAVITSEVFNLCEGKVLTENNIDNFDALQTVKLSYVNHEGIPILPTKTMEFSTSDRFTSSNLFSPSNNLLLPSNQFSLSNQFSSTNQFSSSNHFSPSQNPTVFVKTKRPIYSNSVSLTYVLRKSISFSISFFLSNTYSISFNKVENTYVIVSAETNYYSYFPYIIRFLSPSYVETYISINKIIKKTITQEQLIGITCGSASVFFLVLGVIILFIRHRNESKQIYDEFEDISYSLDEVEIQQSTDKDENQNQDKINSNYSGDFM